MLILQWTLPDLCSSFSPLYLRLTCPNAPCFLFSLCSLILPHRETSSLSSDAWMNTGSKLGWETKSEFALCSLQRWVICLYPAFSSLLAPSRAAQTHLRVVTSNKGFWLVWKCRRRAAQSWSEGPICAVPLRLRLLAGAGLCASLAFAGLTVVFRCTFCLRELTSATAGRNLTVAAIWVNVSPLSAPVYLIN